tara:strand:+ start:118 stop:987 length:870 start_codon:yes stop_codon:yes gene_type:complete
MAEENKGIEELLQDSENLQKAINIIKEKDYVVNTKEDYSKMDETIRKEIGSHFGSKLNSIDQALAEHLGIEKEGNEPTDAFITRVVPGLKKELDTLKKQRDEGLTGAEGLKAENVSLLEKLNLAQKEKEDLETNFKTTLVNKDKEYLVNKALSKLDFKEGIETILNPAKESFVRSILESSTLEDGKLVFKDSEGVTQRNDKNEPVTVFELANKQFESVLSNTHKKQGFDNKPNGTSSSLLQFAASRKPTNFGEADATLKAYYEQKGERLINGSKEYLKGIKELKSTYNF